MQRRKRCAVPCLAFSYTEYLGDHSVYYLLNFIKCNVGTWGLHHNLIIIWIISCGEHEFSVIYKHFYRRSICKDFYIFKSVNFSVAEASAGGYRRFTLVCEMHLEPSVLIVENQFIRKDSLEMIFLNSIYIYFIYRAAALGKLIESILKLLFFCIQFANRSLADFAIFWYILRSPAFPSS